MIDLNFIRYAITEKQEQMKTASLDRLPGLLAETNGLLRLFEEGEASDQEQIRANKKWLSRPLGVGDERTSGMPEEILPGR